GVSPGSIFGWETGRTIPRGGSRARLIALRRKKGGAARGRGRKASRGRRPAARSRNGRRSRRGWRRPEKSPPPEPGLMVELNDRDRALNVNIVYYGPAVGGKTTNHQI